MMRRWAAPLVALIAIAPGALAACSSEGTVDGNCRRFVKVMDDVSGGDITSNKQLLDRLESDIGEFPTGTELRISYDRMIDYLAADDKRSEVEIDYLYSTCLDQSG